MSSLKKMASSFLRRISNVDEAEESPSPSRLSRFSPFSRKKRKNTEPQIYRVDTMERISANLGGLLRQEILSDMILEVYDRHNPQDHRVLYANMAILAAQSVYLRELILLACRDHHLIGESDENMPPMSPRRSSSSMDFEEETLPRIVLRDVPADAVLQAIMFIYSGSIALSDSNVIDIFLTANMLMLDELKSLCQQHIETAMSCDSLKALLEASRHHEAEELEGKCIQFFQNNVENAIKSKALLGISEELLIDLLCKDFTVSNEVIVFQFTIKWGKRKRWELAQLNPGAKVPSLADILMNVMRYVRVISMSKEDIEQIAIPSKVIPQHMLLEVLFVKLQYGLVPPPKDTIEDPYAVDEQGHPIKFYLRPRKGKWKTLHDFESETQYAEYLKAELRPGMLLCATNTYEQVEEGDIGTFVQYNTGTPPCQVQWERYGNTYWLHWKDLQIIS